MTGTFYEPPSNPSFDPFAARAQHQGVPMGNRDQVIVDIPRYSDPQFAPVGAAENAIIDQTLARADAHGYEHAAPFDPEAYAQAQAAAGNPAGGWAPPPPPAQEGTPVEEVETLADLTDAERAELHNFFAVGKRQGSVKVLGHTILCQTLNANDEMAVGKFVGPYMNTPGFVRAWTVATVAAGIRTVDGRRIYDALGPIEDESDLFEEKVRLVGRAFPYAITPVYDKIQELDAEFNAIAERLSAGKMFG